MRSWSFIGIDLAWSSRNSTGVAALVLDGDDLRVVENGIRRPDDEILLFVQEHLAPTTVVSTAAPRDFHGSGGASEVYSAPCCTHCSS